MYSGNTPHTSNPENFFPAEIPWIRTTDLTNSSVSGVSKYISKTALEKLQILPPDTVLVAMYGGLQQIGRTGLVTKPSTINQALSALLPNPKVDSYFLITQLNSKVHIWKSLAASSRKDPNITKRDVESFQIMLPHMPEQRMLSSLIENIDRSVALHERKLKLLKQLKKAYLQQLFPENEEKTPSLRFAGFADDWEQRKLGDVAQRITRKNANHQSELPLTISAQDGLVDQQTFFDKKVASKDISGYYLVKNGEFAYNKSYSNGYPWGAIKRLNRYDMGVLSTLYIVFKPTEVHSDFLEQYFDSTRWYKEVSEHASEGARNHGLLNISPDDFFTIRLSIPCEFEEQKQISDYLIILNKTIALHQRKLESLHHLKQAYLQKLFV